MARIFDQGLFTKGEINYITQSFDNDSTNLEENFDKVLKINETVCLIADTNTPNLCAPHDTKAKDVLDQGKST